jgi:hypothetical protein
MKLLFCPNCWDIFKLDRKLRSCSCGKCKGKYLEDDHHAVVNGEGYSLAMDNNSFVKLTLAESFTIKHITCWARPHTGEKNPNTIIQKDL